MSERSTGPEVGGRGAIDGHAVDGRRAQALAVLGLPAEATPAQITRRFRELAKATHPDTSPPADGLGDPRAVAPDMSRQMTAICDAYHLLTAPAPHPESPAAAPVTVPVRRRTAQRPDREPWIVAGPVRVRPWRPPASGRHERRSLP